MGVLLPTDVYGAKLSDLARGARDLIDEAPVASAINLVRVLEILEEIERQAMRQEAASRKTMQ